jgi:hypothetical protein
VYHCHILSHEEMDMMRPVLVALPPVKPAIVGFDPATTTLSWTDNSLSETAFVVEKRVNGAWTPVHTVQRPLTAANTSGDTLTYVDATWTSGDQYRVVAQNTVGDTAGYGGTGFPTYTVKSVSDPFTAS